MRLAKNALSIALLMLAFVFTMTAQSTLRSEKDNRNTAPTVGTGGSMGGPTGLFTIYDGQTLRKGEFTFSAAYSNYDRDPGDADITEVPVSFQIGLGDHLELFFNTDAYRAVKINSPNNLSSFRLPNVTLFSNTLQTEAVLGAIVLAPQGPGASAFAGSPIFRRVGAPLTPFPFVGGNFGNNAFTGNFSNIGTALGFGTSPVTYGAPVGGSGQTAANFPGLGSIYGSILPGVVLSTQTVTLANAGGITTTVPVIYTTRPAYLPDAPFIGRTYGESSFSTFTVGGKFRLNSVKSPFGLALVPFYRFYADKADSSSGFSQLQRGASPGGNRGDFGLTVAADYRAENWLNVSANAGYIYNSSVKGTFPSGTYTILDRPDEFNYGVSLDFPVNRHFQPILEYRGTRYMGGRTPNAFENNPQDGIAGVRIFPKRWFGMGFAYRYNFNQQDRDSISGATASQTVTVLGPTTTGGAAIVNIATTTTTQSLSNAFRPSSDPNGFIIQLFAGHRNLRGKPDVVNQPANVTAVTLNKTSVTLPCPAGYSSATCTANQVVGVSTTAVDPENDVLTYSYTVSGGTVSGTGANVNWDLTGVRPGTYTITAAVDDGCGFCGQPKSTTITVAECADCKIICSCPQISVSGPTSIVQSGTAMTFTANVSGGNADASATYNWTVSAGTITSGQGTPSITVDTTGLDGQSVTATADVGGSIICSADCPRSASATGNIAAPPPITSRLVDEFDALQADDLKARLDPFFSALQNEPTSNGVIIVSGTDAEYAKQLKELNKAIKFRKYDMSRTTIVRGSNNPGTHTKLYIVPAGAPTPTN